MTFIRGQEKVVANFLERIDCNILSKPQERRNEENQAINTNETFLIDTLLDAKRYDVRDEQTIEERSIGVLNPHLYSLLQEKT